MNSSVPVLVKSIFQLMLKISLIFCAGSAFFSFLQKALSILKREKKLNSR